jgi:hypothetical protein
MLLFGIWASQSNDYEDYYHCQEQQSKMSLFMPPVTCWTLFSLPFNPENGGRIFLCNVGGLTSQKPVVYTSFFVDYQSVFADSDGNLQRARHVLYILCNLQLNLWKRKWRFSFKVIEYLRARIVINNQIIGGSTTYCLQRRCMEIKWHKFQNIYWEQWNKLR